MQNQAQSQGPHPVSSSMGQQPKAWGDSCSCHRFGIKSYAISQRRDTRTRDGCRAQVFLELFNHQVLPKSFPRPLSIARVVEVHLKPSRNAPAPHNSAASSPTAPACHLLLIHPCIEVSLDNEESPMSLIKDRAGRGTGKAN